jgi:hypothetical protein
MHPPKSPRDHGVRRDGVRVSRYGTGRRTFCQDKRAYDPITVRFTQPQIGGAPRAVVVGAGAWNFRSAALGIDFSLR